MLHRGSGINNMFIQNLFACTMYRIKPYLD